MPSLDVRGFCEEIEDFERWASSCEHQSRVLCPDFVRGWSLTLKVISGGNCAVARVCVRKSISCRFPYVVGDGLDPLLVGHPRFAQGIATCEIDVRSVLE